MQITEYVSIEKQMLLDAQKYIERAEMYLAIGKTGHCVGCLAKAANKLHKAEQFHTSLDITYVIKLMIDNLAKRIADSILKP
jgi:ATP/maltotriose-dependent transcriptional regulator MalT